MLQKNIHFRRLIGVKYVNKRSGMASSPILIDSHNSKFLIAPQRESVTPRQALSFKLRTEIERVSFIAHYFHIHSFTGPPVNFPLLI